MANRALIKTLQDFRRHPWLHFISISTIGVALLIVGAFFLCYRNFDSFAEKSNPNVTGTVYLSESLSPVEVESLKEKILSEASVQSVSFKDSQSVVRDLQAFLGSTGSEVMPGSDLFPDVLEVEVKRDVGGYQLTQLKQVITRLPGVTEIDFSEDWLIQYKRVQKFMNGFGLVLILAIIAGCSFIIANFMGMRHQARKNEIEVLQLIGGRGNFILTPFLWEALIEGLLGTLAGLVALWVAKVLLGAVIQSQLTQYLGGGSLLFLSFAQILVVGALGLAMAFFGSFTVFLRFQENQAR